MDSDHEPNPDCEPYVDACVQISRCHRHQHPADYDVPYVANALPTLEDQLAIAAMTVDRGPADRP